MITLEQILTHEAAFGLTKATNVQRAICRAADGISLGDLAADEQVIEAFGGRAAIEALPVGVRPTEMDIVAGIRGGKSLMCGAVGVKTALTCDLSMTRPDEPVQVPILSLKREKAQIVYRHIASTVQRKPALRRLVAKEPTADTISIKRDNCPEHGRNRRASCLACDSAGRVVDILVTAGARAGGAVVAYWCAAVIFDESTRMLGGDEGVINLDETKTAAIGRILPGGQIWCVGSAWAPRGPIYEAVQESFGKPSRKLIVVVATGPMMNPEWWTPERCETVRQTDEQSFQADVLSRFLSPSSSLLTENQAKRAERLDLVAPFSNDREYGASIDPATTSNAWTLAVTGRREGATEDEAHYCVAFTRQWQGTREHPVDADETFKEIAVDLEPYGLKEVWTDRWGFSLLSQSAARAGLELKLDERSNAEKVTGFESIRKRIIAQPEPRQEHPPDPVVRQDMLAIAIRLTPQGKTVDLPQTSDMRHADFAPAIERSCYAAEQGQPDWLKAVQAVRKRGEFAQR